MQVSPRFDALADASGFLRTQDLRGVVVEGDPIAGDVRPLLMLMAGDSMVALRIGEQVTPGEPVWLEPETGDQPTVARWAGFHPRQSA